MYCLTDQQIDFILRDIRLHGISTESLQQSLLDHVCILIETGLKETGDFESFYSASIKTFYREALCEIEEETSFLLTYRKPFAVLSRTQFFLILFVLFIGPFIGYDVFWMIRSNQTAWWQIPIEVWGATLVYSLFPLLIFLVLLLTPDRLEPVIPKKSKLLIGGGALIRIIPGRAYNSNRSGPADCPLPH